MPRSGPIESISTMQYSASYQSIGRSRFERELDLKSASEAIYITSALPSMPLGFILQHVWKRSHWIKALNVRGLPNLANSMIGPPTMIYTWTPIRKSNYMWSKFDSPPVISF